MLAALGISISVSSYLFISLGMSIACALVHSIATCPWRVIVQPVLEGCELGPGAKKLSRLSPGTGRGMGASIQHSV